MSELYRRLRVLLHRDSFNRDLEEEMRSHLEMEAEENRANGMDLRQARNAAKRRFGNGALLKEESREIWGWGPVERLLHDVRYAARALRKNPGFAAVAVVSLAVGIGANTSIFTVVNASLLRVLPVRDPGQLVIVHATADSGIKGVWTKNSNNYADPATGKRFTNTFSLPALTDFRSKAADAAEAFAFFSPWQVVENDGSGSRPVQTMLVSGNFFQALGVSIVLGRGLLDSDDHPAPAPRW